VLSATRWEAAAQNTSAGRSTSPGRGSQPRRGVPAVRQAEALLQEVKKTMEGREMMQVREAMGAMQGMEKRHAEEVAELHQALLEETQAREKAAEALRHREGAYHIDAPPLGPEEASQIPPEHLHLHLKQIGTSSLLDDPRILASFFETGGLRIVFSAMASVLQNMQSGDTGPSQPKLEAAALWSINKLRHRDRAQTSWVPEAELGAAKECAEAQAARADGLQELLQRTQEELDTLKSAAAQVSHTAQSEATEATKAKAVPEGSDDEGIPKKAQLQEEGEGASEQEFTLQAYEL